VDGDGAADGKEEGELVVVSGERDEAVQYTMVNSRLDVSDTTKKGADNREGVEKVKLMVERKREVGVVEGTKVEDTVEALILTSLCGEGVGEYQEDRKRVEGAAVARCGEGIRVSESVEEDICVDAEGGGNEKQNFNEG
ncbi:hypothetical protein A2U01_0039607, partial [Trifolium medium]|nr:hypothetical protein [Trifolium medium]